MSGLASARGGRKGAPPLEMEIVRELGDADLALLEAPPPVAAAPVTLARLRHSHHALAQCLASGKSVTEAALMSGYDPATVSRLKSDPAFAELLVYYQTQREMVFVDVAERMKQLGLSGLDELQARLEAEPEGWSKRELLELSELMLIKGRSGPGAGGIGTNGGGPAVSVNIEFISAPTAGPVMTLDGKVA